MLILYRNLYVNSTHTDLHFKSNFQVVFPDYPVFPWFFLFASSEREYLVIVSRVFTGRMSFLSLTDEWCQSTEGPHSADFSQWSGIILSSSFTGILMEASLLPVCWLSEASTSMLVLWTPYELLVEWSSAFDQNHFTAPEISHVQVQSLWNLPHAFLIPLLN